MALGKAWFPHRTSVYSWTAYASTKFAWLFWRVMGCNRYFLRLTETSSLGYVMVQPPLFALD